MNKKIVPIILILTTLFIVIFGNIVFAELPSDKGTSGGNAKVITTNYDARKSFKSYTELNNMGKTIIGVIRTIGVIVALCGLIIIGIKYMAGSVEQRAEYKKTMIPYILGCLFIFAISWIVSFIYKISTSVL